MDCGTDKETGSAQGEIGVSSSNVISVCTSIVIHNNDISTMYVTILEGKLNHGG